MLVGGGMLLTKAESVPTCKQLNYNDNNPINRCGTDFVS